MPSRYGSSHAILTVGSHIVHLMLLLLSGHPHTYKGEGWVCLGSVVGVDDPEVVDPEVVDPGVVDPVPVPDIVAGVDEGP